jgi:hypothetical protein
MREPLIALHQRLSASLSWAFARGGDGTAHLHLPAVHESHARLRRPQRRQHSFEGEYQPNTATQMEPLTANRERRSLSSNCQPSIGGICAAPT